MNLSWLRICTIPFTIRFRNHIAMPVKIILLQRFSYINGKLILYKQ